MSTDEKRRWPSAKARDYFSVPSADGYGNKLLCDLCHKPVKAPGGKSRPSIVRNILMYVEILLRISKTLLPCLLLNDAYAC